MNFETVAKQIALFYKTSFDGAFETLALKIKKELGNTDIVQYVPVPPQLPPELPRLVMSYGTFNLNFSKNRVDLHFKELVQLEQTLVKVAGVIEELGLEIVRVGFVQKKFLESEITPLLSIIAENVRPAGAKEINVRANLPKEVSGYECNNIEALSFVTGSKQQGGQQINTQGILVERDINTLPEKQSEYFFTKDSLPGVISAFEKEANTLTFL